MADTPQPAQPAQPIYVVAPRKSVMLKDRTVATQGTALSPKLFAPEEFQVLLQNGSIVLHDAFRFPASNTTVAEEQRYAKPGEDGWKPGPRAQSPRKWNRNPADLMGKTLDELNVMIWEIDRQAPMSSSEAEAVERLTRDFVPEVDAPDAPEPEVSASVEINGEPADERERPAVPGVPEAGSVRSIKKPLFGDGDGEGEALT